MAHNNLKYVLDKPAAFRAWNFLHSRFTDCGLKLVRGSDFDELERLAAEVGAPPLETHFSPALNTYTPSLAFWLALIDSDGKLVCRVAARIDDLGSMCLTDFWRKYFHRCYPNAEAGQVRLADHQPLLGQNLFGRVSYLGGLWLREDWRTQGMGGVLVQMLQIDALHEWAPDFFYGWIQSHNYRQQLPRDCGFTRVHFHGIRWEGPLPAKLDPELIFVGNSGRDICDLIDQIDRAESAHAVQSSDKKAGENLPLSETAE